MTHRRRIKCAQRQCCQRCKHEQIRVFYDGRSRGDVVRSACAGIRALKAVHQLALFDGLPIPAAIARAKHRARHAKPRRPAQQLAFSFRPRYASQDAEDSDWDFPEHRILSASEATRVETRAPRSVFDLVASPIRMPRTASSQAAPLYRIEREDGRTRVISMRHDETDEWAEKERIRRAKQRPPKPVRAAKTIGKKLADLVGAREITTTKA